MDNKRDPQPMREPAKQHGDKIDLDRITRKAPNESERPQTAPITPEQQGGVGGP